MPLDPLESLRARLDKLEALLRSRFLERSSIDNGRLRFIGGLLLIDSGGTLQVVGHINGAGDFIWTGPWALKGEGEITGNVSLTGNLDVVDDGRISVGDIEIRDGKIYVGTGASQIVIDGATGRIVAGNMAMDPTVGGGALTYQNGAQVFTDADTIQVFKGNSVVQVTDDYARLQNGGNVVEINPDGVRVSLGAVPTVSGTGLPLNTAIFTTAGYLRRSDGT
jgi:hypothetical protein